MNRELNFIKIVFLGDPIEISTLKKIYNVVNFEYSSEALDQKVINFILLPYEVNTQNDACYYQKIKIKTLNIVFLAFAKSHAESGC